MNQDDLRALFCKQLNSSQHWGDLSLFDEFFESNVVTPKGENRHPFADVYHAAAEGKEWQWSEDGAKWHDAFLPRCQSRIKPSEPVYEWQWDTKLPDNTWRYYIKGDQTHFTDEEIGYEANWLCKVEHTKRERKND